MPVKPSAVYTVASDANYSGGPAAGNPTKSPTISATEGFFPGTAIAAEEHNYLFNISGQWSNWQNAGTPAAVLDSTIVERDADGRSALASLSLGNTAATFSSLICNSNTGQPPNTPTAFFNNVVGGSCITASSTGSTPTVRCTNAGTGPGVLGLSVDGPASVLGLSSSSVASTGVLGEAQNVQSTGVEGRSFSQPGSGAGVLGVCECVDGVGVLGQLTEPLAQFPASAVTGDASLSDSGTGVYGLASNGYRVLAQAEVNAPQRSSLRLVPQDADPTLGFEGDEYHNLSGYRRIFADSIWRSVSTQGGNSVRAFEQVAGPVALPLAVTTVATANLGINNEPLTLGDLEILVEFDPAWGVTGAGVVQSLVATLRDVTAGVDVWTQVVALPDGVANVPVRSFSRTTSYAIPSVGARSFELLIERTAGPTDASARNVVLKVTGVF